MKDNTNCLTLGTQSYRDAPWRTGDPRTTWGPAPAHRRGAADVSPLPLVVKQRIHRASILRMSGEHTLDIQLWWRRLIEGETVRYDKLTHPSLYRRTIKYYRIPVGLMNLFKHLRESHGQQCIKEFRYLECLQRKRARLRNHLRFSLRCRDENITPSSLNMKIPIPTSNARRIVEKARKALINERIRCTTNKIRNTDEQQYSHTTEVYI